MHAVNLKQTMAGFALRPRLSIAAKLAAVMSGLGVLAMLAMTVFMYSGTIAVLVSEEQQIGRAHV